MAYTAQQLVNMGYYGYRGWSDTEANANFLATGGEGKGGPSSAGGISGGSSFDLNKYINDQAVARQAFNTKLENTFNDFVTKFKTEYPQVLSGLEQQLGLPQLRQSAFDLSNTLTNIPKVQKQATRGYDVNANQLSRIVSTKQEQFAPIAQEAVKRAQNAEDIFTQKSQQALVPFQNELDLLKTRLASEATGFNTDASNRLSLLLTQIQEQGATDRAKLSEATKLAELEQQNEQYKQGLTSIDLGNRVALVDVNGNQVGSFDKGKIPGSTPNINAYLPSKTTNNSSGGSTTTDLQTLWDLSSISNPNPLESGSATLQ